MFPFTSGNTAAYLMGHPPNGSNLCHLRSLHRSKQNRAVVLSANWEMGLGSGINAGSQPHVLLLAHLGTVPPAVYYSHSKTRLTSATHWLAGPAVVHHCTTSCTNLPSLPGVAVCNTPGWHK